MRNGQYTIGLLTSLGPLAAWLSACVPSVRRAPRDAARHGSPIRPSISIPSMSTEWLAEHEKLSRRTGDDL